MSDLQEFRVLGLSEEMLAAIGAKGFETPSPIQRLAVPAMLTSGNDIIAQAQTGTGKTAAFGLPMLETLRPAKGGKVQAMVLVPTRELALQVTEELLSFNCRKLSIAPIYGGASISEQLRRLSKGIDIVVGTPGRMLDHIRRGTLDLSSVRHIVLDEADEMLNMGFIEDVEEIMAQAGDDRRVMLFSATMPARIVSLSKKYMRHAEVLKVESQQLTVDLTNQIYFEVRQSDKFDALTRIIDVEQEFYGIVFERTKVGVDELVTRLLERGYAAEGLHGDVSQAQREKILRKFKRKLVNILVATDVAARGIDVSNLSHVINYSLPQDSESYVHRIGRTGRAGNQGTAITFITSSEFRQFGFLRRDIKVDIKKQALPTPQDVVNAKRTRIKEELEDIIQTQNYTEYVEMASELLAGHPAPVAMSALLRMAFKNDLAESNYPEIRSINVDRRGKARLFLSIGRMDGYDAKKMVGLLKRECGLGDSLIDDVKVMDSYSFVSVPFAEAERVIHKLNTIRHGERPLAGLAKDDERTGDESFSAAPRAPRRKKDYADQDRPRAKSAPDQKRSAEPAKTDDKKREKSPAPKEEPRKDDAKQKSAGGFDWSVFEAEFPGHWEGKGRNKKGKKDSAPTAALPKTVRNKR